MKHLLRYKLFESVDNKFCEITGDEWSNLIIRRVSISKLYPNLLDRISKIFYISKINYYTVTDQGGRNGIVIEDNWHRNSDNDMVFMAMGIHAIDDEWFTINILFRENNYKTTYFKCDQLDGLFDFLNKLKNKQSLK